MNDIMHKLPTWKKRFTDKFCHCGLPDKFVQLIDLCLDDVSDKDVFNSSLCSDYPQKNHWCCDKIWNKFTKLVDAHKQDNPDLYIDTDLNDHIDGFDTVANFIDKNLNLDFSLKHVQKNSIGIMNDTRNDHLSITNTTVVFFKVNKRTFHKKWAIIIRRDSVYNNYNSTVTKLKWVDSKPVDIQQFL